jgi:hypothetical protein
MVNPLRIKAMDEAIWNGDTKKVQMLLKAGVPANHKEDG